MASDDPYLLVSNTLIIVSSRVKWIDLYKQLDVVEMTSKARS